MSAAPGAPSAREDWEKTLFGKIWRNHVVARRVDGRDLIYIDRHVMHELHGPHAFAKLARAQRKVRRPDLTFSALDHTVATVPGRTESTTEVSAAHIAAMRKGSRAHGVRVFDLDDAEQGISHVVAPEIGMVLPGATHAVPDSHACTVGGLGALAFGCGTSELEHVLATQTLALKRPKTLRVRLTGRLGPFVGGKDVALYVISRLGVAGARGHAVEYVGEAVSAMTVEERLTLCNLAIEMGARTGLVAPDATTFNWLAGRPWAPKGEVWDAALHEWSVLISDEDARFDREAAIDCANLAPQITWGTDPSQTIAIDEPVPDPDAADAGRSQVLRRALDYMGVAPGRSLTGLPVDRVFIGSCANARLSDLRAAAAILAGRRVAKGVQALVSPGSTRVKREAEADGLDRIFREAGFEWLESGCSMCAGANGDRGRPGERVLSTTNRNFEGRQGRDVRTHLVSPVTAAAAAIAGRIVDARRLAEAIL